MKHTTLLLFLLVALSVKSFAELKLPDIITDHMVLKQKSNVGLWGTELPGNKVTVKTSWNNKTYQAVADANGDWKVIVSTPKAGGPYEINFVGTNTIKIVDVLMGEVWISSGQSNMLFTMEKDVQADKVIPQSTNSQIRLFKPTRGIAQTELKFSKRPVQWQICSPGPVKDFSAMTYYFAVEMQKKLGVPIGVITVAWGGVSIESWMSLPAINSQPVLQNPIARWKKWSADYETDSINYNKAVKQYERTKTGSKPKLPESMYMMRRPHRQYSVLYNAMAAPYTNYGVSGFLWYQGESSVKWSEEYELQLNTLIKSWRNSFNYPDMPVIIGQLTAHTYDEAKGYEVRAAQLNQQKLKNAYVICTMDYGDLENIHPTNKQPYGERFAAMALNKVYQLKQIPCSYPSFKQMTAVGNQLMISFNDAEGLKIKGDKLDEVYVAGADGKFVKADYAAIKKNELVVSSTEIKEPKYARYLYRNSTNIQLYNQYNLPAFPFNATLK